MNFKVEFHSQNLTMNFRNVVSVSFETGMLYENFGPCAHILPPGWIQIKHEHRGKHVVDNFLHIEAILSGRDNRLQLFSGRILESYNEILESVLQPELKNDHWQTFLAQRIEKLDKKAWFL